MKLSSRFWENPQLLAFSKRIPGKQFLFRQGTSGKSMFVLLQGNVELVAEKSGRETVVNMVQPGEFFGEQSLMTEGPYLRAFSARAATEVTVLELGEYELGVIRNKFPVLLSEILQGIFHIAALRLQRANQVVRLLRSSNNVERFVHLILHFNEVSARPTPAGNEVLLNRENIGFYIDMPAAEIEKYLYKLQAEKLLVRRSGNCYVVPDPKALRASISELTEDTLSVPVV